MLKGAIFDLDGVLVKTEYFQWQSWVEALKPFEISLSREDYFNYIGKAGYIIDKELIEKYSLPIKEGLLLKEKEELVSKWLKEKPLNTLHYAKEAIEFFKSRKLNVFVASGGPRDEVDIKLKRTGLILLLDGSVSVSEVKNGKPHPDIYLLALKKMALSPQECVSFEDTQYGIEAAKAAELVCFAIPNEFSQRQDFSKADAVFKNLEEAINWVEENYILSNRF